jgi:hypothetical protein
LRDKPFEVALAHALFLFAYVFEDFKAKATKNVEVFDDIAVMLIEMLDVVRALVHGYGELSPVTLGVLTRVSLELRCNLKFVFTRADPAMYADRFKRFGEFQTVRDDLMKALDNGVLTSNERHALARLFSEWLDKKGRPRNGMNFTGDEQFKSVRRVAKEVGLADDYDKAYTTFSLYVHGSALLVRSYADSDGKIGPLGDPARCKSMALVAVTYCMETLRDTALFFGVPWDPSEFDAWQERIVAASPETGVSLAPRPKV